MIQHFESLISFVGVVPDELLLLNDNYVESLDVCSELVPNNLPCCTMSVSYSSLLLLLFDAIVVNDLEHNDLHDGGL